MFMAEHSGLIPEDLEKLLYNGFDNTESLRMIGIEELLKLGVQENPQLIQEKINSTLQVYAEFKAKHQEYIKQHQEATDFNGEEMGAQNAQER